MRASALSSSIKRSGDVLKRSAADQITDYNRRFEAVKGIYDQLLSKLIVSSFSFEEAYETAKEFFGSEKVRLAAVDGSEYSRPLFDLIVFYGGAFAAMGALEFRRDGPPKVEYEANLVEAGRGLSSCVPMYVNEVPEVDQAFMEPSEPGQVTLSKPLTEEAIAMNSTISSWIMTFSEVYLAYRLASDPVEDVRILLLDRSLSNTLTNLVYDTSRRRLWRANGALCGLEVDGVPIDEKDLAYGRHRLLNGALRLPPSRGDYLKYGVLYLLEEKGSLTVERICGELGIEGEGRRQRVKRYLGRSVSEGYVRERNGVYSLNPRYKDTWGRLKKLVMTLGAQLFWEHGVEGGEASNPMMVKKADGNRWLTTLDLAFLTLFCLYMLLEECWARKALLIGVTKDTAARDFKNHMIPICVNEGIWTCGVRQEALSGAPNTDRMLLQSASLFNYERLPVPWSLIEYDSAFQTIIPDFKRRRGYVSGAVRNKVIPERLFLKSYVQLSQADYDPLLRSNALLIDRLAHPELDLRGETTISFLHEYGGAVEPIEAFMFRERGVKNRAQNLVMVALKAMTCPSVPEAFGHNKPLLVADKLAKWHRSQVEKVVDATGHWIINNPRLRRFVFYMSTFRERRSQIEATRRQVE